MRKNSNAIVRIVIWSIVTFVLIGVLVFFIGFSSSSHLLSFLPVSSGESYGDQYSFSIGSAELEAMDIRNIEINWVSGSVRLYPYEGDTIVIREDSNLSSDDQLRYLIQGDKLIIQFRKSGRFFNWGTKTLNKDLELMLPNDLAVQLQLIDIESVSASVAVEQICAERCCVEQISGETQITDVNLDLLDIEAVSGNVFCINVRARQLDVETVSGNSRLDGEFSQVNLDAVSGEQTLVSAIAPVEIDGESVSGGISITIPECDGFTVQLDTASGELYTAFPGNMRGDTLVYGNGAAEYDFDTVSGNVSFTLK